MRILVTGIAGFIASQVAAQLVARGDEVVGLDNFDAGYDRALKEKNLASYIDNIDFVEGDVRDAQTLADLFDNHAFDAVIHSAALAGIRMSIAEPARFQDVNVIGTCRLAEAMVSHDVKRLVFSSSSSVYGDNEEVPSHETHRVDLPASPYAASKRSAELLLRSYNKIYDLNVASLRYFTVYGPRQRPTMAISMFCRLIEAGEPLTMFGDGESSRDYTFVDDVVAGTIGALDKAPPGMQIYNIGNTHPIKLRDLIERIGKAVGKTPIIERAPLPAADVMHTWANIDKARADLGYAPMTDLDDGLAQYVEWVRKN
jgi:UDP-glucuronate 4-epimerase